MTPDFLRNREFRAGVGALIRRQVHRTLTEAPKAGESKERGLTGSPLGTNTLRTVAVSLSVLLAGSAVPLDRNTAEISAESPPGNERDKTTRISFEGGGALSSDGLARLAEELKAIALRNQPLPAGTPNLISRYTDLRSREVFVRESGEPLVVNTTPAPGGFPAQTVERLTSVLDTLAERLKRSPAVNQKEISVTVAGIKEPLEVLAQAVSASSGCKTNCSSESGSQQPGQQAQQSPIAPAPHEVASPPISATLNVAFSNDRRRPLQPGPYVFRVMKNKVLPVRCSASSTIERVGEDGKLLAVKVELKQSTNEGAPAVEVQDCDEPTETPTKVRFGTVQEFHGFAVSFDHKDSRGLFFRPTAFRVVFSPLP